MIPKVKAVITKVKVCSHGQIVETGPYPDARVWHTETQDFCTDRPETLQLKTAWVSV